MIERLRENLTALMGIPGLSGHEDRVRRAIADILMGEGIETRSDRMGNLIASFEGAVLLQLKHQFLHPSLNCEDLHPEIAQLIPADRIPSQTNSENLNIIAKSSFGFGDVNSCVIFKKIN